MRGEANQIVEAYYNRTCHFLSRCILNTHMHSDSATKSKSNHLKHQAINTLRKVQLNNPLTSSINAFSNRMWHHVSMLLESKHPFSHRRRQQQHLPDAVCSWQPKKASSSYSCDVVVPHCCTPLSVLVKWFSISQLHMHQARVCNRETERERDRKRESFFMLHTEWATVLWQQELKKTHATFTKRAAKKKHIRCWRLFKYSRKTFLILITMASGVNFSYFVFLFQVLTSTVVLAQLLKRSHEKTESWKASLY